MSGGNGISYFGWCIKLLNDHARVLITPHGGDASVRLRVQ